MGHQRTGQLLRLLLLLLRRCSLRNLGLVGRGRPDPAAARGRRGHPGQEEVLLHVHGGGVALARFSAGSDARFFTNIHSACDLMEI